MEPFIEQGCTVTSPSGQTFEAGGAVITDRMIVAYLSGEETPPEPWRASTGREYWLARSVGSDTWQGTLTDWHGGKLGTYRIQSRWRQGGSWMYAICGTVNGRDFHGRTRGPGMSVVLRSYK